MTTLVGLTEDGPDALTRLAGALATTTSELKPLRSRFVDGEKPTGALVPMSAAKSIVMTLPTDKPIILADESNTSGLGSMPRTHALSTPLTYFNVNTSLLVAMHNACKAVVTL